MATITIDTPTTLLVDQMMSQYIGVGMICTLGGAHSISCLIHVQIIMIKQTLTRKAQSPITKQLNSIAYREQLYPKACMHNSLS